jgi:hypothetical protein
MQRVAAAAEAAAKAAAEAASHHASAAAAASHWERWEQAMVQQYGANNNPSGDTNATADLQGSSATAAAAQSSPVQVLSPQQQAELDASRLVRQQQDEEYQASLAADAQKRKERELAALLKRLKAALAGALPPEAAAAASADGSNAASDTDAGGADNTTLAIRVRLPDGSNAVRQFAGVQSFADVLDWVYLLPGMPLLQPGVWGLASSFPRRQLAAAAGLWAPAKTEKSGGNFLAADLEECIEAGSSLGKQQEGGRDEAGYEAAPAGALSLCIRPLVGEAFSVQVMQRSSILEVKQQVEQQTGGCNSIGCC